ncbi:hypothetical protein HID58_017812 [Brassica napus]|uniref:Exostosin GT47 domain-containing protein n=1 Tax=Brassica napus TaxID=3708 RepID=A0ABQ8D893_BRANA|nr:probable xyloglucan galactosyltransferase GT12 [Brassica napus]KAH0925556.1 hypothetical protein HID58_017812 [Brassica napus]
MMKPVPRLRLFISVTFVLCLFVVFQIHKSDLFGKNLQITHQVNNFFISIASSSHHQTLNLTKYSNGSEGNKAQQPESEATDTCAGRYIYMHDLPSIYNDDIIKDCRPLIKWFDMCPFMVNSGLGPQVLEHANKTSQVLTTKTGSWYSTNQFLLSVIFRERMKHYECLTNDSSLASAIYIPYYPGFDVSRHLWGYNTTVRDALATKLSRWLRERPEWNKMYGRDHFFVAGRIGWDFRRCSEDSEWGSNLMCLPEFSNTTMLSIETTAWTNEFAVPYPTYFHPKSLTEVRIWQRKVKSVKRRHLFCFVGAPRPTLDGSIRGVIINQCLASHGKCKFLNCNEPGNDCDNPVKIMDVFQRSVFCLQPSGDSYTRRSIFDSILAGCIPVFFHPGSGYKQYMWYFPKDYTKYSVYIPDNGMKNGTVSLRDLLGGIDKESILRMRNEVVKIIPKIIYTKPGLVGPKKIEDAFDIAVDRVIQRVATVKRMMEEGKDLQGEYSQTRDLKKLE